MRPIRFSVIRWLVPAALLVLSSGCSFDGYKHKFPFPASSTVGGTVSGLSGSGLVLQNNAGNDLPVSANGAFTFSTKLSIGGAYAVTVKTQPSSPAQVCSVTNGSGAVGSANVTTVGIGCVAAVGRRLAYVTNLSSNNVSVVDTASNTVVATVAVGTAPFGVAITP